MKTNRFIFPLRSLLPTLLCGLLAIPVVTLSSHVSAATPTQVSAMAEKVEAVSINTASAAAIAEAMRGVGIKKAEAIVNWRKKNGKYTSLEQLLEIKGIGEKTLEANKGRIKL